MNSCSHLSTHTQVMIYAGPGAEIDLVNQTRASLEESLDDHQILVKTFTEPCLLDKKEVSHIVFPGGNAFRSSRLERQASFIKDLLTSKHYLGICAGAILASNDFHMILQDSGEDCLINYKLSGAFSHLRCTSVAPIVRLSENDVLNGLAMKVHWTTLNGQELNLKLFHNQGPCFTKFSPFLTSIGKYADFEKRLEAPGTPPEFRNLAHPSCAVVSNYTNAKSILLGVHPELNPEQFELKNATEEEDLHFSAILEELKAENDNRQIVWKDILTRLDMPLKL